ncbi:uncharacterized protein LOC135848700 [Planococcus citri]|uniref:uncharacterized protein LOC135848700 n=1 Tax=Planococcus citri TaxID=170843 RepID=UPI0031F91CFB
MERSWKMSHRCWFSLLSFVFVLTSDFVAYAQNEINLQDHLQPLDVGYNPEYDQLIENDTLCSRNCTKYPQPRICYYKLVAEEYHAMGPACKNCPSVYEDCFNPQCVTADGVERAILVFNRLLPGPSFHVCAGDRIIVGLQNSMPARETSIHWHGELQRSSPWEDGVPFVTQCPIMSNTLFRYDFNASTSGTHFYHSHSPLQVFNGLSGPFVVRTSALVDPASDLYDYDLFSHTIQIGDWMHELIDTRYPGYNKDLSQIALYPDSYLINGIGTYTDPATGLDTDTPIAEFNVVSNNRYRFRIITASSSACALQFAIENHSMLLIAADGMAVEPVMVKSLYLNAADIYDVVITANQPIGSYWIRVQGYGDNCSLAYQKAILRYEGVGNSFPTTFNTPELFDAMPNLPELNNAREPCQNNATNLCLDEVNSLHEAPERLLRDPDQRFIFEAGMYNYTSEELYDTNSYHRHYLPSSGPGVTPLGGMYEDTMNNKSNTFPPVVLLSDPRNPLINQSKCPDVCLKHCDCLNLIKLGYNNVIEMIFIDRVPSFAFIRDHPFHIHGHHWSIMKQGTLDEMVSDPDWFRVNTTNKYPLIRQTVPVPAHGFAIVRFIANNPGFWLLHCHFAAHNDNGMQIVLQVGEPEQFPQVPGDWPKCGNYLPPVH